MHGLLLAASLAGAVVTSRASDWDPAGLVVLLAALAIASDAMAIETASMRLDCLDPDSFKYTITSKELTAA